MKIILAVDGSTFSDAAVQAVMAQARGQDMEIRVLHVVEPPSSMVAGEMGAYDPTLDAAWQVARKQARMLVEQTADQLRAKGLNATGVLAEGNPKSEILDAAKDWPADLVVLGSHGRKGLEHFLMGSVSEAVARHAPCSVAIVRIRPAR